MNANFAEILSMQLDDIKPLKPLPAGQYLAIVVDEPEVTQKGKNSNSCIIFKLRLMQALDQSPSDVTYSTIIRSGNEEETRSADAFLRFDRLNTPA